MYTFNELFINSILYVGMIAAGTLMLGGIKLEYYLIKKSRTYKDIAAFINNLSPPLRYFYKDVYFKRSYSDYDSFEKRLQRPSKIRFVTTSIMSIVLIIAGFESFIEYLYSATSTLEILAAVFWILLSVFTLWEGINLGRKLNI